MDSRQRIALTERLGRLERANRRWRGLALAGFALAMVVGAIGLGRPQVRAAPRADTPAEKPAEEPAAHVKLAEARLELSRRALEIVNKSAARGFQIANQEQDYYRWSYRMLGDQIYLSMADTDPRVTDPEVYLAVSHARPNPARTAAFVEHLKRMKWWEELNRPLARKGTMSVIDFSDIQASRLEAELWLARERIKEREAQSRNESEPEPKGKEQRHGDDPRSTIDRE